MAIIPLTVTKPPRRWAIYGHAGSGKSTLLLALKEPVLVIDADQRIVEVAAECDPSMKIFSLSEVAEDHCDIERICEIVKAEVNSCEANSIFVDSLTTILSPLVQKAMLDAERKVFSNRSMAFKMKALLMKMLQDTLTQTGKDIFYTWHLEHGVFSGEDQINHSVPQSERERLMRSLNAMLQVVEHQGKRGLQIDWSKRGVSGVIVWDDKGNWEGVPERVEAILNAKKPRWNGPTEAIQWAVSVGAYSGFDQGKIAYDSLKQKMKPKTSEEMFTAWSIKVEGTKKATTQSDVT